MSAFRTFGIQCGQPPTTLADSLELGRRADAAGFGIVSCGDLVADSFAFLAALAPATSYATLLGGIAGWSRSPVATALAARTVAELSGGRFALGLGPQPKQWSEGWHSVDYARPVERMRDYVAAIRAAAAAEPGAPVTHKGPFYAVREFAPFAPPRPSPVYLAATLPGMARLAGEVADGVVFNAVNTPAWLRERLLPAVEEGLAASGRTRSDIDVGVLAVSAIGDDALRLAATGLGVYFVAPYFGEVLRHAGCAAEAERGEISERVVRRLALVGSADEVRDQVDRYADLADWVAFTPPIGLAPAEMRRQTELALDTFGMR